MKKLRTKILFFSILLCVNALGQPGYITCLADYDFGDAEFGISPDFYYNGESFETGTVGVEYYDLIHMLIPQYANSIDSQIPQGLELDSLEIVSLSIADSEDPYITYTPEELGLNLICNNNGDSGNPCSFLGNSQYCASVEGIPTLAGVFKCSITITGWVSFQGIPISQEITWGEGSNAIYLVIEEQESTSENSCSELFISEYIEGNGNNKAIEFYNPTGDYIELDGYTLIRYGNGSISPSDSAQLWGTVAPYSTWVLVNGQSEDFDDGTFIYPACDPILQSLADQLDSDSYPAPTYFNGDDALVLTRYGEVIDIFGKVGEDPGSAWTDDAESNFTDYNGGTWLTNNHTLQRKYDVSEGVTSNPLLFDTFLEWDTLPVETWEGLGYHDCYCNEFSEEEEEEEVEFNLCESDFEFGDIEFGISPNPDEGEALVDGYIDSAYDETIHFLLPSIVSDLDPSLPAIPLDSARIESIHYYIGDPTDIYYSDQIGLDLICNNNGDLEESCNFIGDSQYCLSLQGFPNISGEFECVITFEGFVTVFGMPITSFFELPHISLTIHEEQLVEGCTDEIACNYNPDANFDDGSCGYESCYGCTDSEAINYSEEALYDDGSCMYLDLSCDNLEDESWALVESGVYPATSSATFGLYSSVDLALHVNDILVEPTTGQEYEFVNFELTNVEGLPLGIESDLAQTQIIPIDQVCISLYGIPYEFGIFNVQFTGVATISLFGLELELNNFSFSHLLVVNENPSPVTGCTYFGAINYNPEANLDDGSCEIDGCTDPEAFNYSPLFTIEDGSCIYNTSDSECVTDINNDGIVTIEDLLTLLGDFGQECE